jgi:hypothetical protein
MTLYVTLDAASLSELVLLDDESPALWCATLVLRRADGQLGFDLREGDEVLNGILGEVVVVEAANEPRWVKLERGGVAAPKLAVTGRVAVACSDPGAALVGELGRVRGNRQNKQKNDILLRHARDPVAMESTWFTQWISEDGRLCASALRRLVAHSAQVSLWFHWGGNGYTGRVLSLSREGALASVARLEGSSRVSVVRVEREAELPAW